jgi:DNA polymerase I-like protein with 3'-5' exonuclease and polymerase domains
MNSDILGEGEGTLAIILDYPSKLDAIKRTHLWGDDRKLLDTLLQHVGFDTKHYFITFAIPHQVQSKTVPPATMQLYGARLRADLADHGITKILTIGAVAYACTMGYTKARNVYHTRGRAERIILPGDKGQTALVVGTLPLYYLNDSPDLFTDICTDIQKLARVDEPCPLPKLDFWVPETPEEVSDALAELKSYEKISCDLETSGFLPDVEKIWAFGLGAIYPDKVREETGKWGLAVTIPKDIIYDPKVKNYLQSFMIDRPDRIFIFHNMLFDLKFLTRYFGQSLIDHLYAEDTILRNYVLDERPIGGEDGRGISPHGLKTISRVRYDAEDYAFSWDDFHKTPDEERDWMTLYKYLSLDLMYTSRLYEDQTIELNEEPDLYKVLKNLLYPGTMAFVEIELRGILVDTAYLKKLEVELADGLVILRKRLSQIVTKDMNCKGDEFNPNSPVKVKSILLERFGIEPESTDRETLEQLLRTNLDQNPELTEFLKGIIDYREQGKMLSTFVQGLLNESDVFGRIHASYHLNGTATGRLSCSKPNLQNQPVLWGPKIRAAFIAPKGFDYVNADYSQLELRVAAHLSGDENMIQVYLDHRDLHREVASIMYHKPADQIDDRERYFAKYVDFGLIYQRGAQSIAEGPELADYHYTVQQAQELIDNFLNAFPKLKSWMAESQVRALKNFCITTPMGRKRRFPFITRQNRTEIGRKAVNTQTQSLASDCTLTSLIKLHSRLKPYNSFIVGTVHDSIMFEVDHRYRDEVCALISQTMSETPFSTVVPFEAKVEVGPRWSEVRAYHPQETVTAS